MQAARGASLTSDAGPTRHAPRTLLLLGVAACFWAVDLASKQLAESKLLGRDPIEVLGPVLRLNLTRNPGAAFSTGSGLTPVISLIAIAAFVVVVYLAFRVRSTAWAWALGLLLAGVAGNLTDRIFREPGPLRGHVVDFLELPNWPIFNIADVCINVAAGLIILQTLRGIRLDGERVEEKAPDVDASGEQDT